MKLLFDQNLSSRLVQAFADLFPDSSHVKMLGLASASDFEVWSLAKPNGYSMISKDGDFSHLSLLHGPPPKVIWLKCGNASTLDIEHLLRDRIAQIQAFEGMKSEALLIVRP